MKARGENAHWLAQKIQSFSYLHDYYTNSPDVIVKNEATTRQRMGMLVDEHVSMINNYFKDNNRMVEFTRFNLTKDKIHNINYYLKYFRLMESS